MRRAIERAALVVASALTLGLGVSPGRAQESTAAAAPAADPPLFAQIERGDGTTIDISVEQLRRWQQAMASTTRRGAAPPIDPPGYSRCVAFLRERHEAPGKRRARCARLDRTSRNTAANQLITLNWIVAEVDRRAIRFTEARIAHEIHATIVDDFDGLRSYRRFQRETGLTDEDVRLNIIGQNLGQKAIVRQIFAPAVAAGLHGVALEERRQELIDAFRREFYERSFAATRCAPEYASLEACSVSPVTAR